MYAPTEDSEKEEKYRFYASLEGVLEKVKKDGRLDGGSEWKGGKRCGVLRRSDREAWRGYTE